MSREENIQIFEDSMQMCKSEGLRDIIRSSIERQEIIPETANFPEIKMIKEQPNISISRMRSFQAAEMYKDKKTCVLNFASAHHPGGGVKNGSNAQEESLCRVSTLYPCLSDQKAVQKFYKAHKGIGPLYNSDIIYTPDVTVFKSDVDGKVLEPDKWFSVDVLTCAAPNMSCIVTEETPEYDLESLLSVGNGSLPKYYEKMSFIVSDDARDQRLKRIIQTAILKKVEVLVLGAFGCGVFENPPERVSFGFASWLGLYGKYFQEIHFAIYDSSLSHNYEEFESTLDMCFSGNIKRI